MNLISTDLTVDTESDITWFEKTPEPDLEFDQDPVALACGSYRLFLESGMRWAELRDIVLIEQDHAQADKIRKYYTDRILMSAIAARGEMSEFRRKLYGLLIGHLGIKRRDVGLLYRLPYFYAEDTAMDQIMEQTDSVKENSPRTREVVGRFQLIQRINVSRRSGETVQLWLQKGTETTPYMIAAKADNPFLSLIESMLTQPIKLTATAHLKHVRGHYRNRLYYQLAGLALA